LTSTYRGLNLTFVWVLFPTANFVKHSMRKPIFLTVALLLLLSFSAYADGEVDRMTKDHDEAQKADAPLSARLTAIKTLGRSCPTNCQELMHLKAIFKDLLKTPLGDEYKHNLLLYHTAEAIGNYGPFMRELAPDLTARMGRDRILDGAIEEALMKIFCPFSPPMCPSDVPLTPPFVPFMPKASSALPISPGTSPSLSATMLPPPQRDASATQVLQPTPTSVSTSK
jgi:hypothetical protein